MKTDHEIADSQATKEHLMADHAIQSVTLEYTWGRVFDLHHELHRLTDFAGVDGHVARNIDRAHEEQT